MKICPRCEKIFQSASIACTECHVYLIEISLPEILRRTDARSFQKNIHGGEMKTLPDEHIQYHIRSYLGNRSLFLDFDIQKNRVKHGPRLKRFFIAPINMTCVFNIPWFFFNLLNSNFFHLAHTRYCDRCDCKYIPGRHTEEECDYNIEYFNILEDILSGHIIDRRPLYQSYALEILHQKKRSAYVDLFCRKARWEAFWDITSITLSIMFWVFIVAYIAYPMFQILIQKLMYIDAYEFALPWR